MKGCSSADKIAELVGGDLAGEEAGGVHQHVRGCGSCRAVVAVLGADIFLDSHDSNSPPGETPGSRSPDARDPIYTPVSLGPFAPGAGSQLLKPGAQVGRFRIERMLGRGGMGTVWEAADPELGRKVALKVLLARIRAGDDSEGDESASRERLLREAQAMARLSHPNVVPVFEIGEVEGRLFLVMELVVGQTLEQWLRGKRSLSEVLDKFIAAGEGLAAAHAAGVIHRDFKPENVLVGKNGAVRVGDFGLAREHLPDAVQTLEPLPPALLADLELPSLRSRAGLRRWACSWERRRTCRRSRWRASRPMRAPISSPFAPRSTKR